MSAHLLPVSAEWLARLPHGVLVDGFGRTTGRMYGSATEAEILAGFAGLGPLALDLTDTVTAAVVAAKIVRPWSDTVALGEEVISGIWYSDIMRLVGVAGRMKPLTPDQIETLARLARAVLEAV